MALRKGEFLSGILGPIILKIVEGKQYASSKPAKGTVKQSEETKKSNNTFGMASSLSAKLRQTIANQLNNMFDIDMCSRLTAELFGVLGVCRNKKTRQYKFERDSFARLAGFNFNKSSRVENRISEMPAINREKDVLSVDFKTMKIENFLKFPYRSFNCRLLVSVSLFHLETGRKAICAESADVSISKVDEYLAATSFRFVVPDGCFYVVCLFLEYVASGKNGARAVDSKKLNPGCICAAATAPGVYKELYSPSWDDMVVY